MAKIFISYKYADKSVKQNTDCNWNHWLSGVEGGSYLTARNYVDHLIEKVLTDHTSKAEKNDEDLSHLTEEVIQQKLYDRIYDSTITIVLISKNMKEAMNEKLQWIPQEIAYSLREKTRDDRTSCTNGVLAVVLPDENGVYDHGIKHLNCVTEIQTNNFFNIISKNMFNRNEHKRNICTICGTHHHYGDDHSYVYPVKWDDFIKTPNVYIDLALDLKNRLDEFKLTKTHE
jgi:hypothetical protein